MKSLVKRTDFPIYKNNKNLVFFDSAASALKPQQVIDEIVDYYQNYSVNIHRGVYNLAYQATKKYESARCNVAKFINADASEISFTSGTTASLNMITLMLLPQLKKGDEIIVSHLEHHSAILPWIEAAKKQELVLKYIPLEENRITVRGFQKVLSKKTRVVALTHISNVLGYLTPIEEITKLAHENEALVILDAAQSAPHIKLDVKKLGIDFLAFSGHKLLGPTGIGVLYGKKRVLDTLNPVFYGGEMVNQVFIDHATYKTIPFRFEAGTPPISEAIGLSSAIDYLNDIGFDKIHHHEMLLYNYVVKQLQTIPEIIIYNSNSDIGMITFNVLDVHPHDAATIYDKNNICLRAGHHCAQLVNQLIEVPYTLRLSLYIYNDKNDCDRFIESTKEVIEFFKNI